CACLPLQSCDSRTRRRPVRAVRPGSPLRDTTPPDPVRAGRRETQVAPPSRRRGTRRMGDFLSTEVISTFLQVIMIDLVLAGDNAVVIGLAAAGLPREQRNR